MLLNLRRIMLPGLASGLALLVVACSNPTLSANYVIVSVAGASSVALGSTSQYVAKVAGSSNQAVTWTVNQASGGNAQVGSISTAGLYSAPAAMPSSGTITIAEVSAVDSSISGIISVALQAAPATATVTVTGPSTDTIGTQSQYSATVTGAQSHSVTWSINGVAGGNATVGTIAASGMYTAPASVPANNAIVITATSVVTPGLSGNLNATILGQAATTPAPSTLSVNRTSVAFQDVVVNTSATQSVTLASTGTEPVTVTAAALTGKGFAMSGIAFPLTLDPSQTATLTVQFLPTAAGVSTGQITVSSNSSASGTAVISLNGTAVLGSSGTGTAGSFTYSGSPIEDTLVPANPSTAISKNFFGLTIANLAPNSNHPAPNMTPFPPFPVSALRLWDVTYWAMIDSTPGENNWSKMDNSIAIAQQNGVSDFIFTFGRVPPWASTGPTDACTNGEGPGSCTFPNMSDFDEFATQVVQRYCGKVKYYETWNEPNNPQFWDGTNAQLLTISQSVYRIVKDPANCGCTNGSCSPGGGASPNSVLMPAVSGVGSAEIAWLNAYLAEAAAPYPYADIATFHGYSYPGNPPENFVAGVQLLKQTLATNGLSELDLWNTEASWKSDGTYDEDQQASWLMRYHALQAALSISRFVWYAYDNCSWGTLWSSPLCTDNQGPTGLLTEPGNAYSTIENWFIGANLTHCQGYQNGLWACELQRAGNYDAWMLWSSTGTNISVPVPATLGLTVYRDWQNNVMTLPTQITVSQMPVLLENHDL